MRIQNFQSWLILGLILFSGCQDENQTLLPDDKAHFVQGEVANLDSFEPPTVVKMQNVQTVELLAPDTLKIESTYQKLTNLKIIPSGIPKIIYEDAIFKDSTEFEPLIGKKRLALKPTKIDAKPPKMQMVNDKIFSSYDNTSGLKTWYLLDIDADTKGNLWGVMASAGVFRFDGAHFYFTGEMQNMNPYSTRITLDKEENVWISTGPKLAQYDGKYLVDYLIDESINISTRGAFSLFVDEKDLIWFSSNKGLFRIDPVNKTKLRFNEKHGILGNGGEAHLDELGNIWITNTTGVYILKFTDELKTRFDLIHYSKQHGLESEFFTNQVEQKMYHALDGTKWLYGTSGFTKLLMDDSSDYGSLGFMHIGTDQGISLENSANAHIRNVGQDKEGNYIVSLAEGQLLELNINGQSGKIRAFDGLEGVDGSHHTFRDSRGNLWLSNFKYMLTKVTSNPFKAIEWPKDLAGFDRMEKDKQGGIWGTAKSRGIYRYIPAKNETEQSLILDYTNQKELNDLYIRSMFTDSKGSLWVGTYGRGLLRFDFSANGKADSLTLYNKESGFDCRRIPDIIEDKKGNIWCSVSDDFSSMRMMRENEYIDIGTKQGIVPGSGIWGFGQSENGSFWGTGAGTQTMMNFHYHNNTEKIGLRHFSRKHHISGYLTKNITPTSNGHVWFGGQSSDGLTVILDLENNEDFKIKNLTQKEGMPSTDIYSLLKDHNEDIWVSTAEGLAKVKHIGASSDDLSFSIMSLNKNDGYESAVTTVNQLCQVQDSLIWINNGRGIMNAFNPFELNKHYETPTVSIEEISIFNEEIPWQTDGHHTLENGVVLKHYAFDTLNRYSYTPENLSLRYDNNYISFDFAGRTLINPHRVTYSYRLEGFNDNWSKPSNSDQAVFGKLKPGHYVFHVKAGAADKEWSEPVSYAFCVRHPWWRSWLAYLIYFLVTVSIIYAIVKMRVRTEVEKVKALEKLRRKISSDLHDDVGSILTGIAMQSEFLSFKKPDDLEKEMTNLSHMSRNAMEKMRDIVWALDTSKGKIINLIDKMRHYANEQFGNSRFKFSFEVNKAIHESPLGPNQKQNIYLIFKECITNILKHSNGDQVTIKVKIKNNNIILYIHDNGTKVVQKKTEGSGLRNIKARTHALAGQVQIDKQKGFGLSFLIPLK